MNKKGFSLIKLISTITFIMTMIIIIATIIIIILGGIR